MLAQDADPDRCPVLTGSVTHLAPRLALCEERESPENVSDLGAGERIRTADLPLTRSMALCTVRTTCTDDTGYRTNGTHCTGIIRRAVPRTVPRRGPGYRASRLLCVTPPGSCIEFVHAQSGSCIPSAELLSPLPYGTAACVPHVREAQPGVRWSPSRAAWMPARSPRACPGISVGSGSIAMPRSGVGCSGA